LGPRDSVNLKLKDRSPKKYKNDCLELTQTESYGCPFMTGSQTVDMSDYIRKDSIPCWGCNLK
jgi:hypothetical protein